MDFSAYGVPDVFSLGATGLPPGLSNTMGRISGTPTTAGTYTVTIAMMYGQHSVSPYSQVSGTFTLVVDPVTLPSDTTAPVITMNGTDVTLTVGDTYADQGATCTDNVDATCTVTSTSTVDTTAAGDYTVTYNAIDAAGNAATPVVRTVTVNPAQTTIVSTGIKVEGTNKIITAITPTTINI